MIGINMETGLISNIQFYSTKDGPGIRTTVFCVGCNLKCVWCANPELIDSKEKVMYYKQRCIQCGKCVSINPEAITLNETACSIQRDKVKDWDLLVNSCPKDAYEKKGMRISSDDLVKKLLRDKEFYQVSNGGVTFSGGEAALQALFVKECAQKLHQNGIHVALDTAGLIQWNRLKDLIVDIDLILFDIKAYNSSIHKKCTGCDNTLILQNLKEISKLNKDLWIRLVIVPGWNDDLEDIKNRFKFIKKLGSCVKRVDVLKYHNLGSSKYEQLGIPYSIAPNTIVCDEFIQQIKTIAKEEQVDIHIEN